MNAGGGKAPPRPGSAAARRFREAKHAEAGDNAGMVRDDILRALQVAHNGRYLVRIRAVNASGNTIDVSGYVTELRGDGGIRVAADDPERGLSHDFGPDRILDVERVHRA